MRKRLVSIMVIVGLAVLPVATTVQAGIVITGTETKDGVIFEGGGTLDISLWSFLDTVNFEASITPSSPVLIGSGGDIDVYHLSTHFVGPSSIGPGLDTTHATFSEGDSMGVAWRTTPQLGVPVGYISGGPLSGSSTFSGHTFASLGVEEGTYTWTWFTADGKGDFYTINIIPAPGAFALLGISGLVLRRRRRQDTR